VCDAEDVCAEPTCGDQAENGNETDTDCGGGDCDPCEADQECREDSDCDSNHCAGVCVEATCADGILNNGEFAVDCGGQCPLCGLDTECEEDSHCASNQCDTTCDVGLQLMQGCTRCGTDAIGFQVQINNNTSSDFPISELILRYYFRAEFDTTFSWSCQDCTFSASVEELPQPTLNATHYIEVDFSVNLTELAPGATLTEQIVVDWAGGDMDQNNDYSFRSTVVATNNTTLYRDGVLIWGNEPGNN
jgi:hypothetical protein